MLFGLKQIFHHENKWRRLWLALLSAFIFFILSSPAGAYFYLAEKYENRAYPGVRFGDKNVGGLTAEEIKSFFNKKIDRLNQEGVIFYYEGRQTSVLPIVTSMESDLAYQVIYFNPESPAKEALAIGRSGNLFLKMKETLGVSLFGRGLAFTPELNEKEIIKILTGNFAGKEIPVENASLFYDQEKEKFEIKEERLGKTINYEKGIIRLKENLSALDQTPIILHSQTDYPEIYKKDCLGAENEAMTMISQAPIFLKYENKKWEIEKNILAQWLGLKKTNEKTSVGVMAEKIKDYLENGPAKEINRPAITAKFNLKDGRVAEFVPPQDGLEVDVEENARLIELSLLNNINEITLEIKKTKGEGELKEINNLGIEEKIGIGASNFSGSPANRRHNIKTGANSLHGLIIKPGEEFSLLKALGEIEASTGYLPELVIKNNKTVPEYGGGLCQIGTTIFRAALDSGLPITMRRNHSYRVSYYEPAGTDATIYNPWPDFRFINDTGNHILIQARIEGDNIYFDFWGKKDGRLTEKTEPTIYNIVKPGPTKLIETLELKPGEKKCTERPHNGADAYFDYKVIYANGEKKEERFQSHYVPWQEVCLIGVEELSTPTEETASTTPATEQ